MYDFIEQTTYSSVLSLAVMTRTYVKCVCCVLYVVLMCRQRTLHAEYKFKMFIKWTVVSLFVENGHQKRMEIFCNGHQKRMEIIFHILSFLKDFGMGILLVRPCSRAVRHSVQGRDSWIFISSIIHAHKQDCKQSRMFDKHL